MSLTKFLLAGAATIFPLAIACSNSASSEPESSEGALAAADGVSCDRELQPAYANGVRLADVEVVHVEGFRVSVNTAHAYLFLKKKAAERGITISLRSGFRTMPEQMHLYFDCYKAKKCNNGNLAAKPGFSKHQDGHALDLSASSYAKLNQLIDELHLSWKRTVPSEAWHYVYSGPAVQGVCDRTAGEAHESDASMDVTAALEDAGLVVNGGDIDAAPSVGTDGGEEDDTADTEQCTNDGECNPGFDGSGKICKDGACVDGCRTNAQCPGVKKCGTDKQCH